MSNPNGLLSQNLCHYLNQGRTFYDILMRAMTYFDLGKLNLAQPIVLKAFVSNCNVNLRVKVALKTTYIKNVKFTIIKTRTGCQNTAYFYYSDNLNQVAQNIRLGRMRAAGWT